MKRSRRLTSNPFAECSPQIRLWLLRVLVPLGGLLHLAQKSSFQREDVVLAIGLGDWIDNENQPYDCVKVRATIRRLYQNVEDAAFEAEAPTQMRVNIDRLADLIGLSGTDRRILEFCVLLHTETVLENATDILGMLSTRKTYQVLATILDLPERDIWDALGGQGALVRSGLASVTQDSRNNLTNKLELLSNRFADYIMTADADPVELIRDSVRATPPGTLGLADYTHVAASLDLLMPYLQHALSSRRAGVNVFVYGPPGTGKTELARLLAKQTTCDLFEIASEDADGKLIAGGARLRAFRAAQSLFRNRRAMLLFDETEDVFNDAEQSSGSKSTGQKRKAWMNRMLEENPIPTVWLSNRVDCMDPAFIRRFDMVIELPVPPKLQRARIVRQACPELLEDRVVARIADSLSLAPALITRAASVIATLRPALNEAEAGAAIEHLISNTLVAQGHRPLCRHDPTELPDTYDPAFIHADADLSAIAQAMGEARSGRLCLYGPPGTGKTAYGRWLAAQLGLPIQVHRASDLVSMWVGQTEKNIARAFREAEDEHALLLIDEVDGFLQDRRAAQRGWEVSQVNEMLTQIESFAGVFIASTNLMGGLDPAALRRFDLKVKLGFLRPAQAWGLFERTCASLALPAPSADLRAPLARLDRLTPGDFATVVRQHRFRRLTSPGGFVAALTAEVALKEGAKAAIGFV